MQERIACCAIASLLWLSLQTRGFAGGADQDAPHLTLPPEIYAVAGLETSVYYANTILAGRPDDYHFEVACSVGSNEPRRWRIAPDASQVGRHRFTLRVYDMDGKRQGTGVSTLVVSPADAGQGRQISLLLVGDSLTHRSYYPNELSRLMRLPGSPQVTMLGTHRPAASLPEVAGVNAGVAHEGYGGWTWERFAEHYEPRPDGTHYKLSSPFIFIDSDGSPTLDVPRYFAEKCDGTRPEMVVFMLGINDCYGADATSVATIDVAVSRMLKKADSLLAAFHQAAPEAELGVCLITPGNARAESYPVEDGNAKKQEAWQMIQHRIVQRQIAYAIDRSSMNVSIIPTNLDLDTTRGYPPNDAIHPNTIGFAQVSRSIYAWMKHELTTAAELTGRREHH